MYFPDPKTITPEDFELTVKCWFEAFSESLDGFEVEHREIVSGTDGDYEIDVCVRFTAFGGAQFVLLCECKKHSNPIKREVIQVLNEKRRSIGAHKAFVVSTAPYQSGAEEYAEKHGVALVQLVKGSLRYVQNSALDDTAQMPNDADPYAGFFCSKSEFGVITSDMTFFLEDYLQS